MAKPKKEYTAMSVRLSQPIFDKLSKYCEDSGQSKTVAVERALDYYIDEYYKKYDALNRSFSKSN